MAVNQNINISRHTCVEVSLLFVHLQNIHQEFLKLTFQTLALHQSEKKALICQRVDTQNFMRSLQLPIYIINLPLSPTMQHHNFFRNLPLFINLKHSVWSHSRLCISTLPNKYFRISFKLGVIIFWAENDKRYCDMAVFKNLCIMT